MTTTLPGLTSQTTTEDADLLVLQNIAANRTRTITYANFKNELAADMDIITSAQLASTIAGVTAAYQAADAAVKSALFPVGTKISASSGALTTTNPSIVLGFGTWVKEEGKYYVGHKTGDSNFGSIGGLTGSLQHNHSATTGSTILNETQIPAHTHTYKDTFLTEDNFVNPGTLGDNEGYENRLKDGLLHEGLGTNGFDYDNNRFYYKVRSTQPSGGTTGHTHTMGFDFNLPPSIVEVVWRRTA